MPTDRPASASARSGTGDRGDATQGAGPGPSRLKASARGQVRFSGAGTSVGAWPAHRTTVACDCCASPWRPALPASAPVRAESDTRCARRRFRLSGRRLLLAARPVRATTRRADDQDACHRSAVPIPRQIAEVLADRVAVAIGGRATPGGQSDISGAFQIQQERARPTARGPGSGLTGGSIRRRRVRRPVAP
jgi:hypothetical protein